MAMTFSLMHSTIPLFAVLCFLTVLRSLNMEKSTFGRAPRACSVMDDRSHHDNAPHSYRGFTPILEVAHGRAVSNIGCTFTSSQRPPLVRPSACPVGFYEDESTLARVKHSRGVKRSEPRFRHLVDDASPGPIYRPFEPSPSSKPGMKFSKAARFAASPSAGNGRSQLQTFEKLASSSVQSSSAAECTFGSRHKHLEPRPHSTAPAIPYIGPSDVLAHMPAYAGRLGPASSGLASDVNAVTPGPGHFLKGDYAAAGPQWSFGRRQAARAPPTPGPGAYRIDKYKPFNKPRGETFAKVGHNILKDLPGLESPGPALYSVMGK
ncbi:membrane-associated protein, putative [Bodo saltans]|uniref:Membrane-associated protein, putative n=1 Tax=Bodo saltans TaxID=75058 RepID=A0A0S4JMC9_BODSA|nr:membrane-associated protein, putative [Bodo saltans]|eukprot:CUG92659.1 membrane-associated protein, putative [Bodo saltans]